jgi:hypothetical protein
MRVSTSVGHDTRGRARPGHRAVHAHRR